MKKIFNYLAVMLLLVTGFTACDTEPEENVDLAGYYTLNVAGLDDQYRATIDGNEYNALGTYIDRSLETVELEVFRKSDNVSVFKEEISPSEPIKLIHPVDKELGIAGEYMEFTPFILFSGDASLYEIRFKEWNLTAGELNYIPLAELPGEVTIVDMQNGATPLYSYALTQSSGTLLNLMQVSETDFMELGEDTEPDPTETNQTKVQFFYTDAYDTKEITMKIYRMDAYSWDYVTKPEVPTYSFNLKKGAISDYILCEYDPDVLGQY